MSIKVDLERLAVALADFPYGYLLTTRGGAVKAVTIEPELVDGVLRTQPSAGSGRNLAENSMVTVIFPPRQLHGFTLIVDGTATSTDEAILVTPTAAVLHRPDRHCDGPPPPGECGNDCQPLGDH